MHPKNTSDAASATAIDSTGGQSGCSPGNIADRFQVNSTNMTSQLASIRMSMPNSFPRWKACMGVPLER